MAVASVKWSWVARAPVAVTGKVRRMYRIFKGGDGTH
jgi:hypothetical protein